MLSRRMRHLHSLLEYRWSVLAILAATAWLLGYVGFAGYYREAGTPASWSDLAYLTFTLFPMNAGELLGSVPWELDIARLLAPATLAGAAVSALVAGFRDQMQIIRARWQRDHVVICGLGREGLLFARAFRAAGFAVVVIELDQANPLIRLCRDSGALVIFGNATEADYLQRTRVSRARYLLAVTGDDGSNAEVAVLCRTLVREPGAGGPLICSLHIGDRRLASLLGETALAVQGSGGIRYEFFSVLEHGAQMLLREHLPALFARADAPPPCRLLIVGFSDLSAAAILHAARAWLAAGWHENRALELTIVDSHAREQWDMLVQEAPRLPDVCAVSLLGLSPASAEFAQGQFLLDSDGRCRFSAAFVCLEQEGQVIAAALALRRLLKGQAVPIVACTRQEGGIGALLEDERDDGAMLRTFGVLDRTCRIDVVTNSAREIVARAIHAGYVAEQRRMGQTIHTNPAMVAWDELSESLRESNRRQADHISIKLEAVGCDVRRTYDLIASPFEFTPAEIDQLAEMEHDRWVQERLGDGWKHAPGEKDIENKTHPDLLPWDSIADGVRQLDRNTVRDLPIFLAKAGFEIVRMRPFATV